MSPDGPGSRNGSFKQKQDENSFFAKRSTSGLSQGKQNSNPFQNEPPVVGADVIDNSGTLSSSGKKGRKKKKKRGSKSQVAKGPLKDLPDPLASKNQNAASIGRVSNSGNNFTGSYS